MVNVPDQGGAMEADVPEVAENGNTVKCRRVLDPWHGSHGKYGLIVQGPVVKEPVLAQDIR